MRNNGIIVKPERVPCLDILRILAIIVIFIGHSANQFNCYYWCFQPLVLARSASMSLFFLLSGSVLFINYSHINMKDNKEIFHFYIKRLAAIIPTYYLIALIYIVFLGKESVIDVLKLLPLEVLGLQTTVHSLFIVSHNGGTWFISCLLICYFVYPFIQELIKSIKVQRIRTVIILCIACYLIYIPFVVKWFGLAETYDSPFYRAVEFILGMCLASFMSQDIQNGNNNSNVKGASCII